MIHLNMATMHCFLSTDAAVEQAFLRHALRHAVDVSFHMLDIDGDMSTSDTVLILANGMAGGPILTDSAAASPLFQEALTEVCIWLAKAMAADGEGATKLLTVEVTGSVSVEEARRAARHLAGSLLIKTAIHGADPNWGRIVAVLGASGATIDLAKTVIAFGDICVFRHGNPAEYNEAEARTYLGRSEVTIRLDLGLGQSSARAWGCDLSEAYVQLNS
jgi:glutamate N-acetyltransferase/amino-acid N-acetyltransferase